MLRLPAVSGRFYPSDPAELTGLVHRFTKTDPARACIPVRACLVPHAGYVYSGHVTGEALGQVLAAQEKVLLLTTSDLNHYEDDATTRIKDHKAIQQLLALDPRGLYGTCRNEEISMCGLGPGVAMLTALNALGVRG